MTSAPVRAPLAGHLLVPQSAALLFAGDQPAPLPGSARWTALGEPAGGGGADAAARAGDERGGAG
jgi:hypothetical protein